MLDVLWLFCLSILGQSLTAQPQIECATEMWRILDGVIKELSKEPGEGNFTLYTPPSNDTSCRNASLMCFREEMKVLKLELSLPGLLPNLTKKMAQRLTYFTKNYVQEDGCVECELHPEMTVVIFLNNLSRIFEEINSNCSRAQ